MTKKKQDLMEILKKFIAICSKHKIWYSLDANTLLGAIRHGGFVPWDIRLQVMMTAESFALLKKRASVNIVDSSNNDDIKKLSAFFVKEGSDLKQEQPFIEIRILVPTTIKKMKKFRSFGYWISSKITSRKINTRIAINDLVDKKYEGYLLLEKRRQNMDDSWIQALDLTTEIVKFNNINVNVLKSYNKILTTWYGENYMMSEVPDYEILYISPLVNKKVVL